MTDASRASGTTDMLDIIFIDRNKAYGAYQLRRAYPKYMARALGYGLGLILVFFTIPFITAKVSGIIRQEKRVDVIAELGPPPDIDRSIPPPPPPKLTPPPPTRSTVQFVPPIVKKDQDVVNEEPPTVEDVLKTKADVGAKTKKGNTEAPPSIDKNPIELALVKKPKAPVEEKTYELFDIQKPPGFPGGERLLLQYLAKHIEYPSLARSNNIHGVVAVSFVIGKDGTVQDIKLVKDIGGGCGKEAFRVVQAMPKWMPGEANGHPVKVRFTLPVRFELK